MKKQTQRGKNNLPGDKTKIWTQAAWTQAPCLVHTHKSLISQYLTCQRMR